MLIALTVCFDVLLERYDRCHDVVCAKAPDVELVAEP
jgi:hypothetical protein